MHLCRRLAGHALRAGHDAFGGDAATSKAAEQAKKLDLDWGRKERGAIPRKRERSGERCGWLRVAAGYAVESLSGAGGAE